jgi:D-alanyl-D-alanine dipeptidase
MPSIYKNNIFPFVAIIMALLLCIPLMGINAPETKNVHKTIQAVSKLINDDEKFLFAGLIDLEKIDAGFDFDIRYATTNNFTGIKLYSEPRCFLREETAQKLAAANKEFMSMGYKIKIYDAYRPLSVQKILYAKVPSSKKRYIADPYAGGSNHNRGVAVDITVEHLDGQPLSMPTNFDDFNYSANISFKGCSKEQIKNRELLAEIMIRHGFSRINCEWWHFDDTDASKYSLLDIIF